MERGLGCSIESARQQASPAQTQISDAARGDASSCERAARAGCCRNRPRPLGIEAQRSSFSRNLVAELAAATPRGRFRRMRRVSHGRCRVRRHSSRAVCPRSWLRASRAGSTQLYSGLDIVSVVTEVGTCSTSQQVADAVLLDDGRRLDLGLDARAAWWSLPRENRWQALARAALARRALRAARAAITAEVLRLGARTGDPLQEHAVHAWTERQRPRRESSRVQVILGDLHGSNAGSADFTMLSVAMREIRAHAEGLDRSLSGRILREEPVARTSSGSCAKG